MEEFAEDRGRTVHDRHFRTVYFNQEVVQAHAGAGREKMLNSGDALASFICQCRAKLNFGHVIAAC